MDVCYRNTYQYPENNDKILRIARPGLLAKHAANRHWRLGGDWDGRGCWSRRDAADDEVCLYQITQWSIKHFQDRFAAIEMARVSLPRLVVGARPKAATLTTALAASAR